MESTTRSNNGTMQAEDSTQQLGFGGLNLTLSEAIAFCDLTLELSAEDEKTIRADLEKQQQNTLKQDFEKAEISHLAALARRVESDTIDDDPKEKHDPEATRAFRQASIDEAKRRNEFSKILADSKQKFAKKLQSTLKENDPRYDQRRIAEQLAHIFETGEYKDEKSQPGYTLLQHGIYGNTNIAKDSWKATEYLAKAHGFNAAPTETLRPQTGQDFLGWFTSARLFSVRLDRVLNFYHKSFSPGFEKYVLFKFSYLGFSYGIELLIDFGVLARAWWRGESVKATFYKDGRASRMANAAFWLTCNILTSIFTAGIVPAALNCALFAFDVANETYRSRYQLKKYETLLEKINDQIKNLNESANPDYSQLRKLQITQSQLIQKIESVKKSCYWTIGFSTVLLIAMCVFYAATVIAFPPAIIPVAAVSFAAAWGASTALFSGSVLQGLGKRLVNKVGEWISQLKSSWSRSPQTENTNEPALDSEKESLLSKSTSSSDAAESEINPLQPSSYQDIIKRLKNRNGHCNESFSQQFSKLNNDEISFLRKSLGLNDQADWLNQLKHWATYSQDQTAKSIKSKDSEPTTTLTALPPPHKPGFFNSTPYRLSFIETVQALANQTENSSTVSTLQPASPTSSLLSPTTYTAA